MVNYCCVFGCGRNSRLNNLLNYYSLPKERERQVQWLVAAKREDLLKKDADKLTTSYRFCSRHFQLSSVRNRNLSPDATPTLCLPGGDDQDDSDPEPASHFSVVCNNCSEEIKGFRYKCVTCKDYDLCMKCEMHETHPQHFMLRIARPLKFKVTDKLTLKWRKFFKETHSTVSDCELENEIDYDSADRSKHDSDSSDDEPITKYVTKDRLSDNTVQLTKDIKGKIRNEVLRVLKSNRNNTEDTNHNGNDMKKLLTVTTNDDATYGLMRTKKRKAADESQKRKRKMVEVVVDMSKQNDSVNEAPEVFFADVANYKNNDLVSEIKPEFTGNANQVTSMPTVEIKLGDELGQFMIAVSGAT